MSLYCYHWGVSEHLFIHKPIIYCHFAHGLGEPHYLSISDWKTTTRIFTESLEHYSELHDAVNLGVGIFFFFFGGCYIVQGFLV